MCIDIMIDGKLIVSEAVEEDPCHFAHSGGLRLADPECTPTIMGASIARL
jgi:hypothetical protein